MMAVAEEALRRSRRVQTGHSSDWTVYAAWVLSASALSLTT